MEPSPTLAVAESDDFNLSLLYLSVNQLCRETHSHEYRCTACQITVDQCENNILPKLLSQNSTQGYYKEGNERSILKALLFQFYYTKICTL